MPLFFLCPYVERNSSGDRKEITIITIMAMRNERRKEITVAVPLRGIREKGQKLI